MRERDAVELDVRPPWPYRLPAYDARDGTMRVRRGVVHRLLRIGGRTVLTRAWPRADGAVRFRAEPVRVRGWDGGEATRDDLELAISRLRLAVGVDDDLSDYYAHVKRDRMLGPIVRAKPWIRPRRRPWPWEALAWAVTEQLIESGRAAAIQRGVVRRWGLWLGPRGRTGLADAPGAEVVAGIAPAELAALDLAPARAISLIKVAREVAAGHTDLERLEQAEPRLRAISGIGPWTVEMLALKGQGRFDRLPAGDLAYIKLVGRLLNLGRRATVEEVHEFFAPYEPFKGLAGVFALHGQAHLLAAV
jgi:3-methyladenine DNA glycosylase/8-oxoguanine DNA glycosylase